ncbi:MAG: sigma-70 family RNA polymerase sigma factor [Vicingaceae bacterium]|jgi:RNA polymerase primary sigma factor|tara:strand:- start:2241 stop:3107 length:867 start_codon:yes stop_codon:yes gene_type:complete
MRQLKISKSITNRQSVSLDRYLQEIGRVELITAEEEVALAIRIKEGDSVALEKLTKANLRFVVSVAKQYQNQGLGLSDLINEGNLGLIKAAQKFDETRGFKFISYAVWWIRQSIMQAIAEQSRIVRLPLNKIGNINKVRKVFNELEQKYEREPLPHEIAECVDISDNDISVSIKNNRRHVSMDAPLGNEDDSSSMYDLLHNSSAPDPDKVLLNESLCNEVQQSLTMLPVREAEVLRLFFGLNDTTPHSLEEIGIKYQLTRERVRQIKEKAVRRLKVHSRTKVLKSYLG